MQVSLFWKNRYLERIFAHRLVKVLVCEFKTSFQTSSGFNMVYNKEINEQLEI